MIMSISWVSHINVFQQRAADMPSLLLELKWPTNEARASKRPKHLPRSCLNQRLWGLEDHPLLLSDLVLLILNHPFRVLLRRLRRSEVLSFCNLQQVAPNCCKWRQDNLRQHWSVLLLQIVLSHLLQGCLLISLSNATLKLLSARQQLQSFTGSYQLLH